MKKKTSKKRARANKPEPKSNKPNPHHRSDFEVLLGDAVFGIKRK